MIIHFRTQSSIKAICTTQKIEKIKKTQQNLSCRSTNENPKQLTINEPEITPETNRNHEQKPEPTTARRQKIWSERQRDAGVVSPLFLANMLDDDDPEPTKQENDDVGLSRSSRQRSSFDLVWPRPRSTSAAGAPEDGDSRQREMNCSATEKMKLELW